MWLRDLWLASLTVLVVGFSVIPERLDKVQVTKLYLDRFIYQWFPSESQNSEEITPVQLRESMVAGADWIVSMQEPYGRFHYWYNPKKNAQSRTNDDNFLRQAGTAFSLSLIYEMTGDPRYLAATRKNLHYLLKFRKSLGNDKSYFLFHDKAKLGGISLPMLAMLKLRQLTGSKRYDRDLKELANMILYLQKPYGNGQYKSTYVYRGDYEHEKNSGWESRIYPGEAMYALAFMYEAFGDERYRQSIDDAAKFYIDSGDWDWTRYAFLPWTASAFTLMYELTQDPKYANYGFQVGDALLVEQNLDPDSRVYGSFHLIPSANTGSYLEGLADVAALAKQYGDTERARLYSERTKIGYGWVLKLQLTETMLEGMEEPERGLGGFRKNMKTHRLRIDYTQHIISSMAKGLRNIYDEEPAVMSHIASVGSAPRN